jgi:hypothetical protein
LSAKLFLVKIAVFLLTLDESDLATMADSARRAIALISILEAVIDGIAGLAHELMSDRKELLPATAGKRV